MFGRIAFVLVASSGAALAQPAAPSSSTTPTTVESVQPETATLRPRIYRKGNLRLSIMCAATWVTPDTGLSVTVDGAAANPQRINGRWSFYVDSSADGDDVEGGEVWEPTDVGYLLAPGQHHIEITAPDCSPASFDMTAYTDHAQHAIGRLAVTDWSLMGPVGAPNGWGFVLGDWYGPAPRGPTSNSVFNQTAAFDSGHTATGVLLSYSIERQHLVLAGDTVFATGATSGTVTGQALTGGTTTQAFTGSTDVSLSQIRVGARLPLQYASLMAGTGIGLEWWDSTSGQIVGSQTTGLFAPNGMAASFYLPLWLGVTIKPACNWGVQVMGQYELHPTATDTDGFDVMGGIMYQPSNACSDPPGVHVAPS